MSRKNLFISIMIVISIIGCAPQSAAPTSDLLATIVAGTLSVIQVTPNQPQATANPQFTPIPTLGATLIPAPIQEAGKIYLTSSAENVNLRVGPGRLFQVSRVLIRGTQLELLSMASGGKWAQVRNSEGIIGWVDVQFVNGIPAPANSPHVPNWAPPGVPIGIPEDVTAISGVVTNGDEAMSFIGVAIVQGNQFDEGFTDDSGTFYIYVPTNLTGEWFLQHHSTDCRSNTMDANCQCLSNPCSTLTPTFYRLTFPLANTFYNFGWQ